MQQVLSELHGLRNFVILRDIPEEYQKEFFRNAISKELTRGEIVYSSARGSEGRVFFLISGRIKLVEINDKGAELIKDVIAENEIFGITQVGNSTFEYAQVLTTKVKILSISQYNFNEIIKKNSALLFNYNSILASKIRKLETRYAAFALSDVKERLIYILKEMSLKENESSDGSITLKNYLTQDELAKMIFVSRQTLSRILKNLRETGEISYKRGRIELCSPNLHHADLI